MAHALDYAGQTTDVIITREHGGGLTIVVPTRRSVRRFLLAVASTDLFAFLLVPVASVVYLLFATRRPRAVLSIASGTFTVAETDDNGLGRIVTRRTCPVTGLGEFRPNRFDRGLYVTFRGRDSFNLLPELSADALARIAAEVNAARGGSANGVSNR